jgi:hypothetical protein
MWNQWRSSHFGLLIASLSPHALHLAAASTLLLVALTIERATGSPHLQIPIIFTSYFLRLVSCPRRWALTNEKTLAGDK